jgi:RND family efflux transporter MFP subunit
MTPRRIPVRLLLGVATATSLLACHRPPIAVVRPVPVRVLTVRNAPLASAESYAGEVVPRVEAQLSFLVPGRLEKRLVEVGDRVRAGQVLARLETRDYEIALTSARALLDQSHVERAQSADDLARATKLQEQGAITKASFDQTQTAAMASQARAAYAESSVDRAARDLTKAWLRSPTDGVVIAVTAENGQVISPGNPIIRVASAATTEVAIDLPEVVVPRVSVGSPATVRLWADGDDSYAAHVREIAPESDATSRTYRVKLTLDHPNEKVHLGMSARVAFGETQRAIAVPLTAVFEREGHPNVWIFDEATGHVAPREVVVDRYIDGSAILRSGLSDGERIASAGAHRLDPGLNVVAWAGLP